MIDQERLDTAKKRALSKGALYITGKRDEVFSSPRDVIIELYKGGSYRTSNSSSGKNQRTGPSRSIHDMCRVIWHYLPDATIEECVRAIYNAHFISPRLDASIVYQVVLNGYCSYVRKLVHGLQVKSSSRRLGRVVEYARKDLRYGSSLYRISYHELMIHCGIVK